MADTTEQNPATATPEENALAQALIERERADARLGFRILGGFFLVSAALAALFSFFVFHHANALTIAFAIVVVLIIFGLGRRIFRFGRSFRRVQQNWREGNLSTGQSAIEAARAQLQHDAGAGR